MPVVEGQVFLQVALVAGLIGLLGLVMRWTLHRDPGTRPRKRWRRHASASARDHTEVTEPISPPSGPSQPEAASTTPGASSPAGGTPPERAGDGSGAATAGRRSDPAKDSAGNEANPAQARTRPSTPTSGSAGIVPTTPQREDYGLLAVAAEVATPEEVAAVRRALTAAGIRNTNAVAPDGKHRVLVFGHELIKARRVAGGSQGANGS